MNSETTIRQATTDDRAKLKEIIDLSFPRFFRIFASHSVNSEKGKALVTESQGVVIGFAKLIEFKVGRGKYGCLLWLAVHPEHRRKGIASELVKAGTKNLKQNGSAAVFASVQRKNRVSLATFGKEGFVRMNFWGAWRIFGWRVFEFYREIWLAPGEIVFMNDS
jgi:ribosomal protein S18 acetylase RimI-like enzyme